jgi:hypothetical protein
VGLEATMLGALALESDAMEFNVEDVGATLVFGIIEEAPQSGSN